jgi:mRNA-degrading endonuclease RelE of RelBE toxin-antitoxin system
LPYRILYSLRARDSLRSLTARQRSLVVDGIDEQLASEPEVPTRNRKQMRDNPLAPWELRIGTFRVYYEVETQEETVTVIAVGVKKRDRVIVGGKEIDL